jgi:hypothetical protein
MQAIPTFYVNVCVHVAALACENQIASSDVKNKREEQLLIKLDRN